MTMTPLFKTTFDAIDKDWPADESLCLYKSGTLDSMDLMQFLLELEMETGVRLDLAALVKSDITFAALEEALTKAGYR